MATSMQDDVATRPAAPAPSEREWEFDYASDHGAPPVSRLDTRVCVLFWLGVSAVGWGLVGLLMGSL